MKVKMNFNFPKSNVRKVNLKLIKLYNRIMFNFVQELKTIQPNVRQVRLKDGSAGKLGIINFEGTNKYHYIVTNSKPYASYFETGTGIYGPKGEKIVPKNQKAFVDAKTGQVIVRLPYALHWQEGGQHFFAKSVRGMQKTNPFTNTIRNSFIRIFREVMANAK